jgi:hypothetical protein
MPTKDGIRADDDDDFLQHFATQYFPFHGEAASLVICEQDAFLTELLFEYLVLGSQIFENILLVSIDPAGEDEEQQLPRLQNRFHTSPDVVKESKHRSLAAGCQPP